jgi:hypothetical protein
MTHAAFLLHALFAEMEHTFTAEPPTRVREGLPGGVNRYLNATSQTIREQSGELCRVLERAAFREKGSAVK